MKGKVRSEDSYITHDIIPALVEYGYPGIGDPERVRIKEIPWYRPSGGIGGHMDIVYYHSGRTDGEPILLVEAKRKHKSHEVALKEAKDYIRNFPIDKKEYAPSGKAPTFIATSVGKEIKFYKHRWDSQNGQPVQIVELIQDILPFAKLLEEYGLAKDIGPKPLDRQEFSWFLGELLAVYNTSKNKIITKEVVLNVAWQILSYLEDSENYVSRNPYVLLDREKFRQSHIRELFDHYDFKASLSPNNAREFRRFVLRSFQGTNLNQYMTEGCVITFMVDLVNISPEWKVLDFECGSGGFLAAVIDKRNISLDKITGIDIDNLPYIIAKTYLAIYFSKTGININSIPIYCKNGLLNYGNDWDLVIGNPAGDAQYRKDDLEDVLANLESDLDLNGRPDSFSEYNFSVQQAVRSAKVGGKICLILPEGFFSNSQDEILRKYVAKYCKIHAIISLPRGVFKVGTDVIQAQRGSRTASMKMSILYAEKIKGVIDGEGLDLSGVNLDYPIFLSNINPPGSTKGEVEEWLLSRLDVVLRQWQSWQDKQGLLESGEFKIESAEKIIEKEKRTKEREKLLFEVTTKKQVVPRYKAKVITKTKISKKLRGIFKKNQKS